MLKYRIHSGPFF